MSETSSVSPANVAERKRKQDAAGCFQHKHNTPRYQETSSICSPVLIGIIELRIIELIGIALDVTELDIPERTSPDPQIKMF